MRLAYSDSTANETQLEDQSCNHSSNHSHNMSAQRTASFCIPAGSNVSASLLASATLLHRNSSSAAGEQPAVVSLLRRSATAVVELRAQNRAESSQNKSVRLCLGRKGKPSPHVRVNPTWQPPTSPRPVGSPGHNGEAIFLTGAHGAGQNISTLIKDFSSPSSVPFCSLKCLYRQSLPEPYVLYFIYCGDSEH